MSTVSDFLGYTPQLFTNSASAIPCEVGPNGEPVVSGVWTPGKGVRAWHQRMQATRQRRKEEAEAARAADSRQQ
eukprot:scaffold648043_cov48-Prasinocladus_malaysianus.AAC.1